MHAPEHERNDPDGELDRDPRNSEVEGDEGMPAEFIDSPDNQPGDGSPPNPAIAEGQDR